jgi:hypothetical protein
LTYRAEEGEQEGSGSSFNGEVILESNQEDDDDGLIDINQVELDQNQDFQIIDVEVVDGENMTTPVDAGKANSKVLLSNLTPPANRVTKKLVHHEVRR